MSEKKKVSIRHRVNIVIKDEELNKIVNTFLKQRIPLLKRSVFECFLSQLIEDLWKKMGSEFASFVLCKAYEQVVSFPLGKGSVIELVGESETVVRGEWESTQVGEKKETEEEKNKDLVEDQLEVEEKEVSVDDLLL